jgi:Uma2 family endonuclease
MALPKQITGYSVADYMQWPAELRCELIDGVIYDMAPAPTLAHQTVVVVLCTVFRNVLQLSASEGDKGGGGGRSACQVFVAPVDVVLGPTSVVQPDLIVVCDPAKLANGKNVQGAPDLVVEVLSTTTAIKDRREKKQLYERAGVQEYLMVHPLEFYAEYYRLNAEGGFDPPRILGAADVLRLRLLPELRQSLGEILDWPAPEAGVVPSPTA